MLFRSLCHLVRSVLLRSLHNLMSSSGLLTFESASKKPLFSCSVNVAGNALCADVVLIPSCSPKAARGEMSGLEVADVVFFAACEAAGVAVSVCCFIAHELAEPQVDLLDCLRVGELPALWLRFGLGVQLPARFGVSRHRCLRYRLWACRPAGRGRRLWR